MASVPASMRSSLVMTAKVLRPSGSMSLAILSDSEVAMSALAGLTARIIEFGLVMYLRIRDLKKKFCY